MCIRDRDEERRGTWNLYDIGREKGKGEGQEKGKKAVSYTHLDVYKRQVYIFGIREHNLARSVCKRTDGPGIFGGVYLFLKLPVPGDGISQAKAGSGPELGYAPQDNQIIIAFSERNGGDIGKAGGEFRIGFIGHDQNAITFAQRQQAFHLLGCYGAGGWIIGIAQYQNCLLYTSMYFMTARMLPTDLPFPQAVIYTVD